MIILADTALELRMNAPYWVDQRASSVFSRNVSFDPATGVAQFHATSAASGNPWLQTIIFKDWATNIKIYPADTEIPAEERSAGTAIKEDTAWFDLPVLVPNLLNFEVRVYCNCPAFLWHGSQYLLENRDSLLWESVGTPPIRDTNPETRRMNNVICKHLAAVFDQQF